MSKIPSLSKQYKTLLTEKRIKKPSLKKNESEEEIIKEDSLPNKIYVTPNISTHSQIEKESLQQELTTISC